MRGDASAARKHLESIVAQSAQHNKSSEISGHLCYDAKIKQVWQVLEGGEEEVEKVWKAIMKDPRHNVDEETVSKEEVSARKYPADWGMRVSTFRSEGGANGAAAGVGGPLLQIAYASFVNEQDGQERAVVEELVPPAVEKNSKSGITSWMLYNDKNLTVYQVLEGPPETVEGLFGKIREDPRHQVVKDSVARRAIGSRDFPEWPMEVDKVEKSAWSGQGY